jgi:hypothetical protein
LELDSIALKELGRSGGGIVRRTWKIGRNIGCVLFIWLIFECWISWAAFCNQSDNKAGYPVNEEYSCILQGPVVSLARTLFHLWRRTFHDADAYVALFTAVLAVSTIMLWFSTRDAARGGERAANIAESALTKLERAFVFVKEINLLTDRPPDGLVHQYRVSAILENSGRTPAVRMVYNFNCGHVSEHNIPTFYFKDQGVPASGVLGPQATLQTFDRRFSQANLTQIMGGIDRWFIWGWVDYNDIFDGTPRHRTEFCFEMKARPMGSGTPFIGFPMHDRFNATDDDCLRKPEPFKSRRTISAWCVTCA